MRVKHTFEAWHASVLEHCVVRTATGLELMELTPADPPVLLRDRQGNMIASLVWSGLTRTLPDGLCSQHGGVSTIFVMRLSVVESVVQGNSTRKFEAAESILSCVLLAAVHVRLGVTVPNIRGWLGTPALIPWRRCDQAEQPATKMIQTELLNSHKAPEALAMTLTLNVYYLFTGYVDKRV